MKKIVASIIIIGFMFSACSEDWVELDPLVNKTEGTHYVTEADFFQAILAAYDPLQWNASNFRTFEYHNFAMFSNFLSDDAWAGGGNANDRIGYVAAEQGNADPTAPDFYARYTTEFRGIFRANLVINKVADAAEVSEEAKNQFRGEALFLRAKYYFNLVRLWGNVPLVTELNTLEELNSMPQAAPADIYNQIAADLMEASTLLPTTYDAVNTGRATQWAAKSLLVRVFLFFDGYKGNLGIGGDLTANGTTINKAKALELVEDVINNSGHDLVSDFGDLFQTTNENNIESIFEVQFTEGSQWGDWLNLAGMEGNMVQQFTGMRGPVSDTYASGWAYAPITRDLYDAYEDNDMRRFHTILDAADPAEGISEYQPGHQNTGLFLKKYYPRTDDLATSGSGEHNWRLNEVLIRFSDVLLMGAELNLGLDDGKALQYVNRVRARAGVAELGSVDLDAIYNERRVELAGEGLRYWDLLRRGLSFAKTEIESANLGGIYQGQFRENTLGLMPIPQNEIDLTTASWSQNPGY